MNDRDEDSGGFLIPEKFLDGYWATIKVPRKGLRRVFYWAGIALHEIAVLFSRLDYAVRPYGMTTERKYVKGILQRSKELDALVGILKQDRNSS